MRPGWKTSEFIAAVVLPTAAAIITSLKDAVDPKWTALCLSISGGLYALSRGLVKMRRPVQRKKRAVSDPKSSMTRL